VGVYREAGFLFLFDYDFLFCIEFFAFSSLLFYFVVAFETVGGCQGHVLVIVFSHWYSSYSIDDIIHVDVHTVLGTVAFPCPSSNVQPILRCKIHALRTVVSQIVPGMVSEGEGNDEFAFMMDQAVDFDALAF